MSTHHTLDLLQMLIQTLQQRYADRTTAQQYAWWILEAITQRDAAHLITQKSLSLTPEQTQVLEQWIEKIIVEHMPLQYLLGWVPFGNVKILVEPPVLIPRPETEEWCYALIEKLKRARIESLRILELCCGSGCIAIALAKAFPKASITAVDIAEHALALSKKNATLNDIHTIEWIHSDLFSALSPEHQFDLIVSNPPYISNEEWLTLDTSVRDWEDKTALVAADNGLEIIERIITYAPAYLQPSDTLTQQLEGQVWIEIGYQQAKLVQARYAQAGYAYSRVLTDLEGKERVVVGALINDTNI